MCDIWRIRETREITAGDLESHLVSFRELKVKWIVFSGGEPLMHSDLGSLCRMCRTQGIRFTLLTAGLQLEKYAEMIVECMDDVIVSIDGPADIHDRIRGVSGAYRRLHQGIQKLRDLRPEIPVSGRCTIQKQNYRELRNTVRTAHELDLNSLSFLAADTISTAFNRPTGWTPARQTTVTLDAVEARLLDVEIEDLIRECRKDVESGFIVESPSKLRRIALHFRMQLGQVPATSPRCNAPWVSAVLESDGAVRPCFFHRPFGNIHERPFAEIVNGPEALEFRRSLDIPNDPVCRHCVCSLFVEPGYPGRSSAHDENRCFER